MIISLRISLLLPLLLTCGFASTKQTVPPPSCEGGILEEYKRFYEPVEIAWGDSPDVVEFFSYNCNICYSAEPSVSRLKSQLPHSVSFKPYHVSSENMAWQYSQYAFAAAELGGVEDKVRAALFKRMNVDGKLFESKQDVRDFFDGARVMTQVEPFLESDASRGLRDKIYDLAIASGVKRTPTFIVRGKYKVAWGTDQTPEKFAQLILALLEKTDEHKVFGSACAAEITR